MKLYNTLTRKLETFRPQDPDHVKIYTCGPTVYSMPHIGNFAAYVYWDLLLRTLQANGYIPYRVLNLTDVGHLVSDGDNGEDKLEKGARTSGKSVWEVADFYIKQFIHDYRSLNLLEPNVWARATDYIKQDMALVDLLTEKGYTYETRDGIYFDTSKFPTYADFARLDLDNLKAGARVELSDEKRNISDFAVWKFIQPGEKHAMRWDYRGRPGYPGWHLECSSIIHAVLGEPIDIHTGGIDHVPVHHTNEIAQSEAAFGKSLAHYWLHCNHLTSEGQKISKSLGNGYTLADLDAKGYSPLDFKMWVLQGHYRSERDFSLDGLEAARVRRLNWRNRVAECYQKEKQSIHISTENDIRISDILEGLNDDLNSPKVFALIDNTESMSIFSWWFIDMLFGLGLFKGQEENNKIYIENYTRAIVKSISEFNKINNFSDNLLKIYKNNRKTIEMFLKNINKFAEPILNTRSLARIRKDYIQSDRLRDELKRHDLTVIDTPDGQIWQYLK